MTQQTADFSQERIKSTLKREVNLALEQCNVSTENRNRAPAMARHGRQCQGAEHKKMGEKENLIIQNFISSFLDCVHFTQWYVILLHHSTH